MAATASVGIGVFHGERASYGRSAPDEAKDGASGATASSTSAGAVGAVAELGAVLSLVVWRTSLGALRGVGRARRVEHAGVRAVKRAVVGCLVEHRLEDAVEAVLRVRRPERFVDPLSRLNRTIFLDEDVVSTSVTGPLALTAPVTSKDTQAPLATAPDRESTFREARGRDL